MEGNCESGRISYRRPYPPLRAVEVIPLSVELWLALARLETPERAKAV